MLSIYSITKHTYINSYFTIYEPERRLLEFYREDAQFSYKHCHDLYDSIWGNDNNDERIMHKIIKTNMSYNGPVKLSSESEQKVSEFKLFQILYSDKNNNLVSQKTDDDDNMNTPVAFYIGNNLFASVRLMDSLTPQRGTDRYLQRRDMFTGIIYYGFLDT